MRKGLYYVAALLALALCGLYWRAEERFRYYPEHVLESEGLTGFTIEEKIHDDGHWYVKARIRAEDVKRLLERQRFKSSFSFSVTEGRFYVDSSVQDCPSCMYYREKEPGPYSYKLYVIQPELRLLQAVETWD